MRAVVLGGGGFIGSHLVAALAERGDHVTAVDLCFPDHRREWWSKGTVEFFDLRRDIPKKSLLAAADQVFHLAANMGGVGFFHSHADPSASADNMRIDLNVLRACRDTQTKLFYASSACALPEHDGPLHEGLLGLGPADQMYGEEKRFMTMLLTRYQLAKVGIFHTIYGPGQETSGERSKFPPAICRKVHEASKDGGEIEIWGDGSQMRTFLFIDDAVRKILRVADSGTYAGPVNIGSSEEVTVRQCADWLCDYAGVKPKYRFDLGKPTGVMSRGCDNMLYDKLYGREEQLPARNGLIKLYDWMLEHEPARLSAAA